MSIKKIILIGTIIFASCNEGDNLFEASIRKKVPNLSFRGVIARKYRDKDGRDAPVFILNNGEKHGFFNAIVYEIAEPGDSVIKISGTLKHILKKKDTLIIFYPQTRLIDIKDR